MKCVRDLSVKFLFIWMPQLLYYLHNSPCWISQKYFKRFGTIFWSLIWRNTPARIKYEYLQYPNAQVGLSVPNPWIYSPEAQLQHLAGWETRGSHNISSFDILSTLFNNGNPLLSLDSSISPFNRYIYLTFYLIYKVWQSTKIILCIQGYTRYTLLCSNRVFFFF